MSATPAKAAQCAAISKLRRRRKALLAAGSARFGYHKEHPSTRASPSIRMFFPEADTMTAVCRCGRTVPCGKVVKHACCSKSCFYTSSDAGERTIVTHTWICMSTIREHASCNVICRIAEVASINCSQRICRRLSIVHTLRCACRGSEQPVNAFLPCTGAAMLGACACAMHVAIIGSDVKAQVLRVVVPIAAQIG